MRTVGLFEAKQKLSELVDQARHGEEIGITRHGKLVAKISAVEPKMTWKRLFDGLDEYRKQVHLPSDLDIKQLIEEGRE